MKNDKSWKEFEKQINSVFFIMLMLINKMFYIHTLFNTDCLFYKIIFAYFAQNLNLQCMKIKFCIITEFDEFLNSLIEKIVIVYIDIDEH